MESKRTLASLGALLVGLSVTPAFAQRASGVPDCKNLQVAQGVNERFEADYSQKQAEIQAHTSERLHHIDDTAKALISSGIWTDADRRTYFGKLRGSAAYSSGEKKKTELLFGMQMGRSEAVGLRASNPPGACSYALSTLAQLDDLRKIIDTQYDLIDKGLAEVERSKATQP